jgi:hypothetical protein
MKKYLKLQPYYIVCALELTHGIELKKKDIHFWIKYGKIIIVLY